MKALSRLETQRIRKCLKEHSDIRQDEIDKLEKQKQEYF